MISLPDWLIRATVAFMFLVAVLHATSRSVAQLSDVERNYFEKHVRPLLVERCLKCHSAESEEIGGNLQLDSRSGWQTGGDLGPAVVPGKPGRSLLIQAVRQTHPEVHMPPDGKLSDREIRILEQWISSGAHDPREGDERQRTSSIDLEEGRKHWSFRSPHRRDIPMPSVEDACWPKNEIDLFVLADLERRGLTPAASADRLTMIRRASFDLTGLPPTPEEIHTFLRDESVDAYTKLVDRLLESPRYGERWGRFWLDVARYADSNGLDENIAYGNAWRYRDYVIAAFNHDKPYDQFVLEQLAGDLLPTPATEAVRHERLIATGFLSLGPKVLAEVDEAKMEMDIIDEQVEAVGRAFMGLTLGCARCHDHKFDPISTEDYYALAGIFKSTKTMEHFTKIARWHEVVIATDAELARHTAQQRDIENITSRIDELKKELNSDTSSKPADAEELGERDSSSAELERLERELSEMNAKLFELPTAMAVTDYGASTDLRVHVRGSVLSQGRTVPRGFPAVFLLEEGQRTTLGDSGSGRLELAEWLVSGRHPLVARVLVNRLWRWHFGRGLVESTDNFGKLGDQPEQQQLLDWLAVRLVENDWSIKKLQRLIMLSSVYRMSSDYDAVNASIDEDNRFHWRANVWRLEAEAIRDTMLAVSGRLEPTSGGSLLHVKNREFLFDHTSKDETKYDSSRRSVYLPIIRNHLYDGFQLFDYTDASVMSSNRATTAVAPQALFLMNGDLVMDAAVAFAERVSEHADNDDDRLRFAYELAFGRRPRSDEIASAREFLAVAVPNAESIAEAGEASKRAWTLLCQTLIMSNEFIHVR